jgi:hypothetical protein
MMRKNLWIPAFAGMTLLASWALAAPSDTAAPATSHTAAPSAKPSGNTAKQMKDGELDVSITGQRKDKMTVGKLDPPAAFNLEDIQNFPEDRLHPVLNNPIAFEEGRDFSNMMDSQDENIIHPWLPEVAQAPFLTMRTAIEKPAKDWTFSVIDQGGTPVANEDGKGNPPASFTWSGDDKQRGHVAVDTVYIPQLATTDRDGYRHTYSGEPIQFASLLLKDKGRTVIEISSKRIFQDKKADLSKEAPVFLDKVCDMIRDDAHLPFAIQIFDNDSGLARSRQDALVKYFGDKLFIPSSQITTLEPGSAEKRGMAVAVTLNGTPGGAE